MADEHKRAEEWVTCGRRSTPHVRGYYCTDPVTPVEREVVPCSGCGAINGASCCCGIDDGDEVP